MTHRLRLTAAVALVALAGLVTASGQTPDQERTLTGCLRAGNVSAITLLRGAVPPATGDTTPRREDYLVVSMPDGVAITDFLNHQVQVQALVSLPSQPPPAPAGANTAERAMKRLRVSQLREVAPTCPAAGRR